jgi:hypothetical protein
LLVRGQAENETARKIAAGSLNVDENTETY